MQLYELLDDIWVTDDGEKNILNQGAIKCYSWSLFTFLFMEQQPNVCKDRKSW